MSDLVEFLRARLDEDEQTAYGAKGDTPGRWDDKSDPVTWIVLYDQSGKLTGGQHRHIARHDPARVLAEVEAKRRIVNAYAEALRIQDGFSEVPKEIGAREALELACKALALPYATHDAYRKEWRP